MGCGGLQTVLVVIPRLRRVQGLGVIITLFVMFFAGKFAIRRLIFDSKPPEKEE